jgi:hypothetical protein
VPCIFIWSLHSTLYLTNVPSSLFIHALIIPSYLASFTFASIPTTPHRLLISPLHTVSDKLSFISFHTCLYNTILPCFLHLRLNTYHPTSSSDLSTPHCIWQTFLRLFSLHALIVPSYLVPSPSPQYLPPHIFFWSLHSTLYLTGFLSSSFFITCPWYDLRLHSSPHYLLPIVFLICSFLIYTFVETCHLYLFSFHETRQV